jgi:hypothetical protein
MKGLLQKRKKRRKKKVGWWWWLKRRGWWGVSIFTLAGEVAGFQRINPDACGSRFGVESSG